MPPLHPQTTMLTNFLSQVFSIFSNDLNFFKFLLEMILDLSIEMLNFKWAIYEWVYIEVHAIWSLTNGHTIQMIIDRYF